MLQMWIGIGDFLLSARGGLRSRNRIYESCRARHLEPMPRPTSVMSRSWPFKMLASPVYPLYEVGIGKPVPVKRDRFMKKDDITCPDCRAGFRRIELSSRRGARGEYHARFAIRCWRYSTARQRSLTVSRSNRPGNAAHHRPLFASNCDCGNAGMVSCELICGGLSRVIELPMGVDQR